ncbi:hypothetical protein DFJ74DRAFT_774670 [Hyaloraphidium curvatum]|nr:hypothetical protein DFJ74DRAFT_774670 [Hyaloraphidium curvatum]
MPGASEAIVLVALSVASRTRRLSRSASICLGPRPRIDDSTRVQQQHLRLPMTSLQIAMASKAPSRADRPRIVAELVAPRLDLRTLARLSKATSTLRPPPDLQPAFARQLAKPLAALLPGKKFNCQSARKGWIEARKFAAGKHDKAEEQLTAALGSMEVGRWMDEATEELLGPEPEEPEDPYISFDEEMQNEFMDELNGWHEEAEELRSSWEDAIGGLLAELHISDGPVGSK